MVFLKVLIVSALLSGSSYLSWTLKSKRQNMTPHFNRWTRTFSKAKLYNITDYDCPDCSWNTYSPNPVAAYDPTISLYNDESIPQDFPEIICMPDIFGYSAEEAERLFPYKKFDDCADLLPHKETILELDVTDNKVYMNCENFNYKGKFTLGIDATEEVLGLMTYKEDFHEYNKPTTLKNNEEYAYGTCEEDRNKFLENVVYHHRPKEKVLKRPPHPDPIRIIQLTWDSVSRRSFFRKMPNTVKYLNTQLHPNFRLFDMKIHNVMGEYSANNIMPQLLGDTPFKMFWDMVDDDVYYKKSIWKVAKEKGFATLFIEEGCTNDLARYLGKEISVDHIGTSFWCAARKYNDFENNAQKQRCIGQKNSHVYVYDYVSEFSMNYGNWSQWVFTHINTAHEASGLLIATMDDDTVAFLQKYLEASKDVKTILIITGDHGMRYGEWFKQLDGSHEHRLPLGLIIASNALLDSIPFSIDTLTHNSNRLTSKLDLFATQLHLIRSLDHQIDLSSAEYAEIKTITSDRYKIVSLLLEKVANNRTCEEIGISAFWCSCLKFVEVTEEYPSLVYTLAQILIDEINEESYKSRSTPLGSICRKLTLDSIQNLWVLSTDEEYYKMQVTVKESKSALFEAVIVLSWKEYRQRHYTEAYPKSRFYDTGKRSFNIMYIRRVDSYAGKCEDLAKSHSIKPELCICRSDI